VSGDNRTSADRASELSRREMPLLRRDLYASKEKRPGV